MCQNNSCYLITLITALVALFLVPGAAAQDLGNCDYNGDGTADQIAIIGKRAVITFGQSEKTRRVTLGRGAAKAECRDVNGDGADELVIPSKKVGTQRVIYITGAPEGNLRSVCRNIRSLYRCEVFKDNVSPHINDSRQGGYSFIALRGCPGQWPRCINVYNSNGELVSKIGEYFPPGEYDSRHYSRHSCGTNESPSGLLSGVRKGSGSSAAYLEVGPGSCVEVPDVSRCWNSSKC